MYRSDLSGRDRSGALVAVAAIHAALLFAFLNLSGKLPLPGENSVLRLFNIDQARPLPPPPPTQQQQARPKEKEGGSAPKNIKSEATPVAAPKPPIVIPRPQQVAVSETPRQGAGPTQGASSVVGPGTGAGGVGNGTGSGTGGNGPGGGGDGGVAEPPHLASPVLTGRDIPTGLLDQWPRGVPVFLRLRINPQGYVSECNVLRGTGNPAIDNAMCNIAHDRLRFRPALNRSGQAVAGWFGYAQRPPR
jgi:protein TonB